MTIILSIFGCSSKFTVSTEFEHLHPELYPMNMDPAHKHYVVASVKDSLFVDKRTYMEVISYTLPINVLTVQLSLTNFRIDWLQQNN